MIGVINQYLIRRLQSCRWDALLEYRDRQAAKIVELNGRETLASGILSKRIDPEEVNEESRKSFPTLKRIWSKER